MEGWPDEPVKHVEVGELVLCRDDFIEWVLKSTNEDSEFRVHYSKYYILVGIDKSPIDF